MVGARDQSEGVGTLPQRMRRDFSAVGYDEAMRRAREIVPVLRERAQRAEQEFEHVPLNARQDVSVTIRPRAAGVYEVSSYPFAANAGEFAFAGRLVEPRQYQKSGGWPSVLRQSPTRWESFRLVAA